MSDARALTDLFLVVAAGLQIAAAVLAIRLVRVTGRSLSWILISAALMLMAVRRLIPLVHSLSGSSASADPVNECIGMLLSAFMLCGVALIRPIFTRIFEAQRELVESERRFRGYFQLPIVGFAIISPDHRWSLVNDRLCDILGRPKEELVGAPMIELASLEEAQQEEALLKEVDSGKVEGYVLDKRIQGIDGGSGQIWVCQALRSIRNLDGTINYYVAIVQDITERKVDEEHLRRAVREKELLLRELYHRTRNNMQIVASILDLERSRFEDPRLVEGFHDIENRIYSMSLVEDKLYRSRDLWSIDLAEYVRDLVEMLIHGHPAPSESIDLQLRLRPVNVSVDTAIPCGLIINELISNCRKHAFPEGRRGQISVSLDAEEADTVRIVVADDGVGVKTDFDFFAAAGMGLETASALAEQLGGSLTFAAEAGVRCSLQFKNSEVVARAPTG